MAQRIEHLTTDQKVGGSNPSERATGLPPRTRHKALERGLFVSADVDGGAHKGAHKIPPCRPIHDVPGRGAWSRCAGTSSHRPRARSATVSLSLSKGCLP